jgi:hypothetical protein
MNPKRRTFWKVAAWTFAGLLFQAFAVFFSAAMIGAGHGEGFCLKALTGPWWVLHTEIWFWPIAGALFALKGKAWARYSLIGLLLFQYVGILLVGPPGRPDIIWRFGMLLVVTYVAVQLFVWGGIVWAVIERRKARP